METRDKRLDPGLESRSRVSDLGSRISVSGLDLLLATWQLILPAMYNDLTAAVRADFPRAQAELEELVRIPSVSAPGFDPMEVRRSATRIAELLEESGFSGVCLLEIDDAHPAVYAEIPAPDGAPTVLLYAHHDVQPPGPAEEWDSTPFEPIVRDGRILGRGAADDKAGVVMHLAAVRAFGGSVPVGVKVFMEGEEEIGSANLGAFLATYRDLLEADVIVIGDAGNWAVGIPALTTSLRGLVDCVVEIRTLEGAVHSGMFGGAVPDAIITLARVISSLHNDDGSIAVQGLVEAPGGDLVLTEAEVREQARTVDGLQLIGEGSFTERLWYQPAISVLAIDAPPISEAINQLVPVARAKVSMRIAPGQDPQAALEALVGHLEGAVPGGLKSPSRPARSANRSSSTPPTMLPSSSRTLSEPHTARPPWRWVSADRSRSWLPSRRHTPTRRSSSPESWIRLVRSTHRTRARASATSSPASSARRSLENACRLIARATGTVPSHHGSPLGRRSRCHRRIRPRGCDDPLRGERRHLDRGRTFDHTALSRHFFLDARSDRLVERSFVDDFASGGG